MATDDGLLAAGVSWYQCRAAVAGALNTTPDTAAAVMARLAQRGVLTYTHDEAVLRDQELERLRGEVSALRELRRAVANLVTTFAQAECEQWDHVHEPGWRSLRDGEILRLRKHLQDLEEHFPAGV